MAFVLLKQQKNHPQIKIYFFLSPISKLLSITFDILLIYSSDFTGKNFAIFKLAISS